MSAARVKAIYYIIAQTFTIVMQSYTGCNWYLPQHPKKKFLFPYCRRTVVRHSQNDTDNEEEQLVRRYKKHTKYFNSDITDC